MLQARERLPEAGRSDWGVVQLSGGACLKSWVGPHHKRGERSEVGEERRKSKGGKEGEEKE